MFTESRADDMKARTSDREQKEERTVSEKTESESKAEVGGYMSHLLWLIARF